MPLTKLKLTVALYRYLKRTYGLKERWAVDQLFPWDVFIGQSSRRQEIAESKVLWMSAAAAAVTALLVCARLLVAANTYYYEVVIICKRRQTSRMIEWDRVPTWKRVHFAFEGFAVPVKKFSNVLKVHGLSRKPLILRILFLVPG